MQSIFRLFAVTLLSCSSLTASAAITTFASRTDFDAAFAGSVRETWDGFTNDTAFANGSSANGITYNSSYV
jgi:hypothetical protein